MPTAFSLARSAGRASAREPDGNLRRLSSAGGSATPNAAYRAALKRARLAQEGNVGYAWAGSGSRTCEQWFVSQLGWLGAGDECACVRSGRLWGVADAAAVLARGG